MGLIARIKDRLFDRRNVIEVESLEVGGQPLTPESLINTTLYRHVVNVMYDEDSSIQIRFINNRKESITKNDFIRETRLINLINDSIIVDAGSDTIRPFSKNIFVLSPDLYKVEITDDSGVVHITRIIPLFVELITSVSDTVTKL